MPDRPTTGELEERTAPLEADGRRIRGLIPYNTESRDLGGWREVIEPTAFRSTDLSELRAVVDHRGVPLGRYPATLELDDSSDGLHWSLDPPRSRADVVEAVERGDMRSGSWRMVVGKDEWRGDVRHVHEVKVLRDVTIVGAEDPAYEAAVVEYRSRPAESAEEGKAMDPITEAAAEERTAENENGEERTEERTERPPAGSLRVEERAEGATGARGLAEEFRTAGFPGETATIPWEAFEDRAVTWTGSVDNVSKHRSTAGPLGYDQRWVWPAVPREGVDASTTSVDVFTQTARALATPANVVRAIDAVTNKPETGSTLTIVATPLNQVANVESGVPNIYLEQAAFNTTIENDLRLALNDGLDKLVVDKFAASGFQTPLANMVLSARAAITTLMAAGYWADTLVLTPAAAEALDVLVSGIASGTADFVFPPGQFAPNIWTLNRRISKTVAAPVVLDSTAFGKLYAGPVSLARFEENAGKTNTSLVRLETSGVFGVERQTAAIRIAAS